MTEAWLPPVVMPGTGEDLLDLWVGDLALTVYNGAVAPGNVFLEAFVTAQAGLSLAVTGSSTLSAEIGDVALWSDVDDPPPNSPEAHDYETLLDFLVPALLPMLTSGLGEVEIPSIDGFTLTGISLGTAGPEDGYVTFGGNLAEG